MKRNELHITVTYDIVTEESVVDGEAADRGWADIDRSTLYSITDRRHWRLADRRGHQYAVQYRARQADSPDATMSLRDAVAYLREAGPLESSSHPHDSDHDWLYQTDSELDEPRYSFHVEGHPRAKRALWSALFDA